MCGHPNPTEGEKLRKIGAGWRIYKTFHCKDCGHKWEERTDFIQYGRGKNEERFELKILE